jgi:hypothetical protein
MKAPPHGGAFVYEKGSSEVEEPFGAFGVYRLPVSNRISRISRISPMIPPPQYMVFLLVPA